MVVINTQKIRIPHTNEMEKAMQQAHGICFAEYERSLQKRIEVERTREKDHRRSTQLTAQTQHRLSI